MKIKLALLLTFFTTTLIAEYNTITDEYRPYVAPPPPLPQYEVLVNRNDYMAMIFKDNELVDVRKVIVGKKGRRTPLVETTFNNIELNPVWDVPPSITDDMIRKFIGKKNRLAYIKRNGYHFISKETGEELDPKTFDWETISRKGPYEFKLKQDAGHLNMLGPVMFVLAGSRGVQMHGTANPELFKQPKRDYSSGCIRIDGAGELAAMLMGKSYPEFEKYRNSVGNKWIRLPTPVKIKVVD